MNEDIKNNDLSKEFQHFYRKELQVYIADIEAERKKTIRIIIGVIILALIISVILAINFGNKISDYILGLFLLTTTTVVIWDKQFKTKAKKNILHKLLSYIGEFKIVNERNQDEYIRKLNIFPYFNQIDYDDRIKGKYKLLDIDIAELNLRNNNNRNQEFVFTGLLITVPCQKKFSGITTIRNKILNYNTPLFNDISLFNNSEKPKLEPVKLEDVKFNELYEVRSTDQIEARYLITTAFMNRLINTSKHNEASNISVSFEYGNVHIALYTPNKDWFEVSLLKPANDITNYKAIIYEIIQITKIIDSLNLEKNIGL